MRSVQGNLDAVHYPAASGWLSVALVRFDNDASHRFCAGCGNRLGKTCPACGRGCDPAHRFCPDCGTSLDAGTAPAPPSVPETPAPTERRLVTTLFCDLVGFTSLSEQLDPERVRGLLTAYFDRCRNVIEGFGGEVDKYTGDAITAFWGARRALPDDAERAVRAGLELIEEVPVSATKSASKASSSAWG